MLRCAKPHLAKHSNDTFAVELSYFDHGTANAIANIAPAGNTKIDVKSTAASVAGFSSEKSTKPTLAAGVDYAVSLALKLRGELEANRFDGTGYVGTYKNTSLSVGLHYNF